MSRKARVIQRIRYFLSFRDFSGGVECVLVQILLIQTVFSYFILDSYPLSGDMIIFYAGQIDLELWPIL